MYTKQELMLALGSEIEYIIPGAVWPNRVEQSAKSYGRLVEIIGNQIMVYDIPRDGILRTLELNIVRIPIIDSLRDTKLYRLVTM